MANDAKLLRSLLFTLQSSGWKLSRIRDDEGSTPLAHLSPSKARTEAVEAITAVDAATVCVVNGDNATSFVFIVNDADGAEIVADYGNRISDIVDTWLDNHD